MSARATPTPTTAASRKATSTSSQTHNANPNRRPSIPPSSDSSSSLKPPAAGGGGVRGASPKPTSWSAALSGGLSSASAQVSTPARVPSPSPSTPTPANSTPTTMASLLASPVGPQDSGRDLTPLVTLPIEVSLHALDQLPARTLKGHLYAFDPSTRMAVLSSPSSSSSSSSKSNPSGKEYTFFLTPQISSVRVISTTPDSSLLLTPLPIPSSSSQSTGFPYPLSTPHTSQRIQRALQEQEKQRARIGKGVTEEGQRVFEWLERTLPVRWAGREIVVLDEVVIREPYGVDDVKGGKGATERVERVKKVLEGERQRRLERQGTR